MNDYSCTTTENGELYHYGVLGMKWGVRRGKTTKAYQKASKKLNKLDEKVTKAENKVIKRSTKYDKALSSMFATNHRQEKASQKVTKAAAKYRKRLRKANKWYKSMEKTFANTDIKMSSEQVAQGKKYLNNLSMDALIHH